jgi:hypothetical protein
MGVGGICTLEGCGGLMSTTTIDTSIESLLSHFDKELFAFELALAGSLAKVVGANVVVT